MASTRYLITGGSGFIGSALVRQLIKKGHSVLNFDALTYAAVPGALDAIEANPSYLFHGGDITKPDDVEAAVTSFQPDVVVNLAAETHVDRSIEGPLAFVHTNVIGTANLLEECTRFWKSLPQSKADAFRVVHVSTDEVFGSVERGMFSLETPYDPSSPYAASKASSDHLVRAWYRTYGLPAIISNCSNNYGPFQFPEKLIPRLIVRALTGKSLPVYGDGSNVRDWIFVEDHARALRIVGHIGIPGNTYLVGSRTPRTNLEISRILAAILDQRAPQSDASLYGSRIEFVKDRPGHDFRYAIDPRSIEALGFVASTSLEDGLEITVNWFLENRAWWESIIAERYSGERLGLIT